MPVDGSLKLTISSSKLIDCYGREQRADISKFDGHVAEWTSVVTLLEGKPETNSPLVGQCKRRADAILVMQPWRQTVVIPMFTRSTVCFLRVSRVSENSKLQFIEISKPQDMFVFSSTHPVRVCAGFHQLLFFLLNPVHLGYLPCPVIMTDLDPYDEDTTPVHSVAICARSKGKAVFLLRRGDAQVAHVCKAFEDERTAVREWYTLQSLQHVSGIPRLVCDDLLSCKVQERADGAALPWWALVMGPYCSILTASIAHPAHFAQFANILKHASDGENGVNHNDISPDNLMIDITLPMDEEKDSSDATTVAASAAFAAAYIVDWGLSTPTGTALSARTGKRTFLPLSCIDKKTGFAQARTSSLLHDLASLYLVAVCCCKGDVPWANVKPCFHFTESVNYCGLGPRGFTQHTALPEQWRYLSAVADELRSPEPRVERIIEFFNCWDKN